MDSFLMALLSVILFTAAAHGLIKSVTAPVGAFASSEFSRRALRIERRYKIFAFSLLTLFLFYSMAASFIQAFSELTWPF